ncbi:MAG: hypothetical protein HYX76_02410 [Acidobacteria bacterium]|nr:hypothetical protein [Acidobacteriota bacterium]
MLDRSAPVGIAGLGLALLGAAFAQETVPFADYYPTDPRVYCAKTFERTLGSPGQWMSTIVGKTTVPYGSGAVTGVAVCNYSPDYLSGQLVSGSSDGTTVRALALGARYVSADCSLSAHAEAMSWGLLHDGMIVGLKKYQLVTRDLSECRTEEIWGYLVDIQDVTVHQGRYDNAVIMWTLDLNHPFRPLNLHSKEYDLGVILPTASDTRGYSITGFEAYGVGRGLILSGDVDAGSGVLNDLLELTAVACDGPIYDAFDVRGMMVTAAWGANDNGAIVGQYRDHGGVVHAFLRSKKGELTTIDFPGATATYARDINNRGDTVGGYRDAANISHGFLLRNDVFTTIDAPGGVRTEPTGVNARGDIVGLFAAADAQHGFLLRNDVFTTIDFPGAARTQLLGINDSGDVVGAYYYSSGPAHGFLLSKGAFAPIDVPDAQRTEARGINAAGAIVGTYALPNGLPRGFLLRKGIFETIEVPCAQQTFLQDITNRGDPVGRFIDSGGITYGFSVSP